MKLRLALCFLDEENNIIAEEDLNTSWDTTTIDKNMGQVESVLIYDDVAAMLNDHIDSYTYIRNLLDKVKGL